VDELVANRFVEVELVSVALAEVKYEVEAVSKLAVTALEVVALDVEALDVRKLDCVPHNVVIVARVEVKLVNTADKAVNIAENRLVVVALVREAF